MVETQPRWSLFRRAPWLAPVLALGLAALSASLGQVAQAQILAKPNQPITFIVEDGLPHGITQEAVDAAAAVHAQSYEPFTMMVVGRELTWNEYEHGELPDGVDVMLSVGFDEDDIDLVLPDATRVSVAKLADDEDWMPAYRLGRDIRETFLNNLTQGHGASAVVGAGLTAALGAFDGGVRSPVFWISIAVLPLLLAILVMVLWARSRARERARKRTFTRARLHLARVVLELDLLEARVLIAGAELDRATDKNTRKVAGGIKGKLNKELASIRDDSLRLAHEEQVLTRAILDPRAEVHDRGKPTEPMPLAEFVDATNALRRRTSALIAASSLRVGHAAGGDVLGEVALATTLALDEIVKRTDRITKQELRALSHLRVNLLALVSEAESAFGADSSPETVAAHADLMRRWREAEQYIAAALAKIDRRLRRKAGRDLATRVDAHAIARAVQARARIASGGTLDSLSELRASLDLTPHDAPSASEYAERVLLMIAVIDGSDSATEPSAQAEASVIGVENEGSGVATTVLVPLVAAIVAGIVAMSTMADDDKTYGKTLTGAEPLAALHVAGDPSLLPPLADGGQGGAKPENIDTLTVESVRESMERTASYGEVALLPERLELIVALLPIAEYIDARPHPEADHQIQFDYLDLLAAYPLIKTDVAAQYPDAVDPVVGDVRPGYAILPLWIADDGSYGAGLPLTGTLSTGVQSRLGAYDFVATEVRMVNQPDNSSPVDAGFLVSSEMSELGRVLEYNNLREQTLAPSALFWTVAIATWTGVQALVMAAWSMVQLLRHDAGTRSARRALRELRQKLNRLALGLDLSALDAVAVLGSHDGHDGKAAEADQQLYETMLLTAWREVQELESLPRRMQRGPEWRAHIERLNTVITALTERDTAVAERALDMVRAYS